MLEAVEGLTGAVIRRKIRYSFFVSWFLVRGVRTNPELYFVTKVCLLFLSVVRMQHIEGSNNLEPLDDGYLFPNTRVNFEHSRMHSD